MLLLSSSGYRKLTHIASKHGMQSNEYIAGSQWLFPTIKLELESRPQKGRNSHTVPIAVKTLTLMLVQHVFLFLPTFNNMHQVRMSATLFDFTYQLQASP